MSPDPLAALLSLDRMREALDAIHPYDRAVVLLMLDGCSGREASRLLGRPCNSATECLDRAAVAVLAAVPEYAGEPLRRRKRPRGPPGGGGQD
jgi:DNA-directed RNA polymerase specialized sigma24 family protein